ncbi:MAG: hypothetical protein ABIE43_04145 [Patescibacteria group bacterium]
MIFYVLGLILIVVIISSLIFFFFVGYTIYIILFTKVPFARTPLANIIKIFQKLKEYKFSDNLIIYDLGCGDGGFLFFAEKLGYKAVGYELSLYQYIKCVIKKRLLKSKVEIFNKDFFREDLAEADIVFIFLVDKVMKKVSDKLRSNLRPKTLVISYGFKISGWIELETLNTCPSLTYIYKV